MSTHTSGLETYNLYKDMLSILYGHPHGVTVGKAHSYRPDRSLRTIQRVFAELYAHGIIQYNGYNIYQLVDRDVVYAPNPHLFMETSHD